MSASTSRPAPRSSPALADEGRQRGSETRETSPRPGTKLLTAAQLAERWQVPVRTVYAWARRNAVPHYRAGRLLRFDPRAVEEHFRRHGFAEELVADPERPGESAFSLLDA